MTILQNFIYPSAEKIAVSEMYIRPSSPNYYSLQDIDCLTLTNGARCSFDTYFNALNVKPWKNKCAVDDLFIAIGGNGALTLEIHHLTAQQDKVLARVETILVADKTIRIPILDWPELTDGMIYIVLKADETLTINHLSFQTDSTPTQDVKLGIVVTHFKRKPYVVPAIQRVSDTLLSRSDIRDKLALIVVDNSQDITAEESGLATVIPNLNLGGSGGFTRGLLHLKDNAFSHCLFMDDDASCEMESIYRTYRLLQYARTPNLAVCGAMLMEHNLYESHEIGALIKKGRHVALGKDYDLRQREDILTISDQDQKIDYGAWWHFAFKIDAMQAFPFPFFVRGDDQLFSLANSFDIINLNGVAVWSEDFATKDTVASKYLSHRSSFMLLIWDDIDTYRTIRSFWKTIRDELYSYNYDGVRALIMGAEDFLKGPAFWVENIDMTDVFPRLGAISASTRLGELTSGTLESADDVSVTKNSIPTKAPTWHKLLRQLTLNGHLLPQALLSNRPVLTRGRFNTQAQYTFGRRKTIQLIKEPNLGFELTISKRQFFTLYCKAIAIAVQLGLRKKSLRKQYMQALPGIMSEDFWRKVYGQKQ